MTIFQSKHSSQSIALLRDYIFSYTLERGAGFTDDGYTDYYLFLLLLTFQKYLLKVSVHTPASYRTQMDSFLQTASTVSVAFGFPTRINNRIANATFIRIFSIGIPYVDIADERSVRCESVDAVVWVSIKNNLKSVASDAYDAGLWTYLNGLIGINDILTFDFFLLSSRYSWPNTSLQPKTARDACLNFV